MNTYTTCYDMCTQRSPYNWSEQLYERHGETIKRVSKGVPGILQRIGTLQHGMHHGDFVRCPGI